MKGELFYERRIIKMKNIIASFILFFILLTGIFFSVNYINKTCIDFQSLNNKLEYCINNNDWDKSYDLSIKFIDEWKLSYKYITLYMNHNDLDSINDETLKLTQYIKCKNKSDALAIIHSMKFTLNNIMNSEKITFINIF